MILILNVILIIVYVYFLLIFMFLLFAFLQFFTMYSDIIWAFPFPECCIILLGKHTSIFYSYVSRAILIHILTNLVTTH